MADEKHAQDVAAQVPGSPQMPSKAKIEQDAKDAEEALKNTPEYPKKIEADGLVITVNSAEEEKYWMGAEGRRVASEKATKKQSSAKAPEAHDDAKADTKVPASQKAKARGGFGSGPYDDDEK